MMIDQNINQFKVIRFKFIFYQLDYKMIYFLNIYKKKIWFKVKVNFKTDQAFPKYFSNEFVQWSVKVKAFAIYFNEYRFGTYT